METDPPVERVKRLIDKLFLALNLIEFRMADNVMDDNLEGLTSL
jgi:hypothetical protein